MNYDLVKNELIKLKREELDYIDNVAKISSNKILSEYEKLEIYRTLNNYQVELEKMFKKLLIELEKNIDLKNSNYDDIII